MRLESWPHDKQPAQKLVHPADVHFLKIEMKPGYETGQVVTVSIPGNDKAPLHVEIPDSAGSFFYAQYCEDDNGVPHLVSTGGKPSGGEPIVVPTSAVVHPRQQGMVHIHLLWEGVLPLAVYTGTLLAAHFLDKRDHDFGLIILQHLPMLVLGPALIWFRYQRSIMTRELVYHFVMGLVGVCLTVIPYFIAVIDLHGTAATIMSYFMHGVWIPLVEQVYAYFLFRTVAMRGVIVDAQGVIAYAAVIGLTFGLVQNILAFLAVNLAYPEDDYQPSDVEGAVRFDGSNPQQSWWRFRFLVIWIRTMLFALSIAWPVVSATRFAQRRFLGVDWHMWMCILPSIVAQSVWGITWQTLLITMHHHLGWAVLILGVLFLLNMVFLRMAIVPTQKIPAIDLKRLVREGQIKPRSVSGT